MFFRISGGKSPRPTQSLPGLIILQSVQSTRIFMMKGACEYVSVTDEEALEAFKTLSHLEGIIPALESAHAVAYAMEEARAMKPDEICIINLSGRGDKDVQTVADVNEGSNA